MVKLQRRVAHADADDRYAAPVAALLMPCQSASSQVKEAVRVGFAQANLREVHGVGVAIITAPLGAVTA